MVKKYLSQGIKNILPYLLVFVATLYTSSDPDLGWHLKYGEYFFKHLHPLYENTFSSEMTGYTFVNIAWASDAVTFAIFKLGGFLGLTIVGALLVTMTFFFFSKAFRLDYWEKAIIFPILLYFLQPINLTSFRSQQISLAFLGILTYLINRYQEGNKKILFLAPVLFFFWANLHGLFLMGLVIFGLWQVIFISSLYFQKKDLKSLIQQIKVFFFLNLISFLATLIHPHGINIYSTSFTYFNNPLIKSISEYLPPAEFSWQWFNLFFTAILAGVGITSYLIARKFAQRLSEIGIFSTLFILSLWIKRFAWAMYYTLIPLLQPVVRFIRPESKKGQFIGATLILLTVLSMAIFFKYPFSQFKDMSWEIYCQKGNGCSAKAVEKLKEFYVQGKTMTLYNWGGWLIWNYPDIKPSVDGRMHLWRDNKGYSAFEHDYNLEQNIKDINSSKYEVVLTDKTKPIYFRLQNLRKENLWNLVFEDATSVIFVRLKS